MKEDRWKENFLIRLHDESTVEMSALNNSKDVNGLIETFWKDDNFTVWGLPFYNESNTKKSEFNNSFGNIVA